MTRTTYESHLAHHDALRAMAYAAPRDARLARAYRRAAAELAAAHTAWLDALRAAAEAARPADPSTVRH